LLQELPTCNIEGKAALEKAFTLAFKFTLKLCQIMAVVVFERVCKTDLNATDTPTGRVRTILRFRSQAPCDWQGVVRWGLHSWIVALFAVVSNLLVTDALTVTREAQCHGIYIPWLGLSFVCEDLFTRDCFNTFSDSIG
jgi:hypothetical protein